MLLIIILLLLIFYYRIFFLSEGFFLGDTLLAIAPHKYFVWENIKRGILPLWNPFKSAGFPEAADITLGLFNPFSLIHFLAPDLKGVTVVALAAYFLAFWGTYLFLRQEGLKKFAALLGGVIFTFSGSMVNISLDIIRIESICFLPWILLALQKRKFITTTILLTLNLLVGQTQHYYMSLIFIAGFLLFRKCASKIKNLLLFITNVGLSLLLGAFALFPQIEAFGLSSRSNLGYDYQTTWSLHPASIIRFFLADFFGRRQDGSFWGPDVTYSFGYVGFFTLMFLLINLKKINKNNFYFLLAAILSLIIALGKFNPFYKLFLLIPGFAFFRNPASWLIIFSFSAACLTAFLAHQFNFKKDFWRRRLFFLGIWLAGEGVILFFISKYQPSLINKLIFLWQPLEKFIPLGFQSQDIFKEIALLIGKNLLVLGLLSIVFYKIFSLKGLILVIFLDLFFFSTGDLFLAKNINNLFQETERTPQIQFLKNNLGPYRFVSTNEFSMVRGVTIYQDDFFKRPPFYNRLSLVNEAEKKTLNNFRKIFATLSPNTFVAYELPSINGYSAFVLNDFQEYFKTPSLKLPKALQIIQNDFVKREQQPDPTKINFNFITFDDPRLTELSVKYVLSGENLQLINYEEIYADGNYYIYENKNTPPRAQVFDKNNQIKFNPVIADINPNMVNINLLDFSFQEGDYLLLRDKYYPGWQASDQNDENLTINKDRIFRKVYLNKDTKLVNFQFKPKSFYLGLKVALTTLVLLLLLLINSGVRILIDRVESRTILTNKL